ncbi:MAG TPA: multidrug efflux RND transporter permease subunit [Pirellulales bacterium]|nr:multidrug efflux RND transporter permease subunit [Pirellulales bacterium]
MISRFFIDRPIFASVLSIVVTLAGAIAGIALPITQYPQITPPTVQVLVNYPGASAQVLADTVAAPIEQQVNGVENMLYMSSQSANDGSYTLTVTFDLGADLNTALVMVQNRVALAMPQLPESVQRQGLTIKKRSPDILLVVNLYSPDGRYDDLYLSNYATINLKDELFRLEGVADITFLGQRDYSIRPWLDPEQLASRDLVASEVARAIETQSSALAAGQVGQPPMSRNPAYQQPMTALGRLSKPEQFGEIVVKANQGGTHGEIPQFVRLRDVARIELGAQNYNLTCKLDGQPSVGVAIFQLPGTNALDVADGVRGKMEELKARFPEGVDYEVAYDTTPFIRESVNDVAKTLLEAVVLVAVVVLAFLQSWRATLIPLIAVPVAIVGTFAVMAALGFSLNNISLLGLVLAISIVVDDAIVVVENVERWLHHGLAPRDAARKAMDEVTGPVIAVALVLSAVFVPCAFISGITGQFFRQFAVTIAASTIISAINSLTLSPALAALLLRPRGARRDPLTWLIDVSLGWFFKLFNRTFEASTKAYVRLVHWTLRLSVLGLLVYGGLLALTYWGFTKLPLGFIPQQDMGRMLVNVTLPNAASVQRTEEVLDRLQRMLLETKGIRHVVGVSGMSFLMSTNSSNFGSMFVILDPFEERRSPELHAEAIMAQVRRRLAREMKDAVVTVFGAPPVPGLGVAGGFKLMVQDRGSLGLPRLQTETDRLVQKIGAESGMVGVFTLFNSDTPQLYMDIDRTKVKSMGISLSDVNQTLQIYLGSYYVNSFNDFGRFWQVNVQADGRFRDRVEDINLLKVRNSLGKMAPLGTLVGIREISGPVMVVRYNNYYAAPISGNTLPGVSSGESINRIATIVDETLPRSMKSEWTELTYMQIKAGNTAMYVFALSVVFVFLALAALYESWTLPLAVILVVPLCLLCSIAGVAVAHMAINIFVQIGFVVLVGLACKNAILIVEFAKQLREEGQSLVDATQTASQLRLRPILMTSFAFVFGVVPLVVAKGAGAEMRQALGVAVFSGMLGVTLFGVLLTPMFFYVIEWIGECKQFSGPRVRGCTSAAFGGLSGLALGWLVWKVGFPRLEWALAGGFILGVLTAVLVTRGRGVLRRRPKPTEEADKNVPPTEQSNQAQR